MCQFLNIMADQRLVALAFSNLHCFPQLFPGLCPKFPLSSLTWLTPVTLISGLFCPCPVDLLFRLPIWVLVPKVLPPFLPHFVALPSLHLPLLRYDKVYILFFFFLICWCFIFYFFLNLNWFCHTLT